MSEVKVSPKKVPITDWVNAVKTLDGASLKDEEKKVFNMVKAHKNIPKTSAKFTNFCIHNLKVKNDKVIKNIWGHLSVALNDQIEKVPKTTKEEKKSKLDQKLKPKKEKDNNSKGENRKEVTSKKNGFASETKSGMKLESTTNTKANKKADTNSNKKADTNSNKKADTNISKKVDAKSKDKKVNQTNKIEKAQPKATKDAKKSKLQQQLKPNKDIGGKSNNNKVETKKQIIGKDGIKKKVSFSKNGVVSESKGGKKEVVQSKIHKPTPKKSLDVKNSKKKKQVEEHESEDDDDDEMSFEMSDDDFDDAEDSDIDSDEENSNDALSFDDDDDDDDDEDDDDDDDDDDEDDDDDLDDSEDDDE